MKDTISNQYGHLTEPASHFIRTAASRKCRQTAAAAKKSCLIEIASELRARGLRMAKTSYFMRQVLQGTVFGVPAVDYAMHRLSFSFGRLAASADCFHQTANGWRTFQTNLDARRFTSTAILVSPQRLSSQTAADIGHGGPAIVENCSIAKVMR